VLFDRRHNPEANEEAILDQSWQQTASVSLQPSCSRFPDEIRDSYSESARSLTENIARSRPFQSDALMRNFWDNEEERHGESGDEVTETFGGETENLEYIIRLATLSSFDSDDNNPVF
jgi:hypothetical protein